MGERLVLRSEDSGSNPLVDKAVGFLSVSKISSEIEWPTVLDLDLPPAKPIREVPSPLEPRNVFPERVTQPPRPSNPSARVMLGGKPLIPEATQEPTPIKPLTERVVYRTG